MDEFKIEKRIPIPKRWSPSGMLPTMRKLKIGDSFTIKEHSTAIHSAANYAGIKVVSRRIEGGRYRIWRIK